MSISLIAALDNNHAIGKGNAMPWHLSADLKRFKALTSGKAVVMGYNTALAIGRALPDRRNLVLSRRHTAPFADQETLRSLDDLHDLAAEGELMVIGGGEIYRQTLPLAQRLYLTWVDARIEAADAWFPHVDFDAWTETARTHHEVDAKHALAFDWVDLVLS